MKEDDRGLIVFTFAVLTLVSAAVLFASILFGGDSALAILVCALIGGAIYFFPQYRFRKHARVRQSHRSQSRGGNKINFDVRF